MGLQIAFFIGALLPSLLIAGVVGFLNKPIKDRDLCQAIYKAWKNVELIQEKY